MKLKEGKLARERRNPLKKGRIEAGNHEEARSEPRGTMHWEKRKAKQGHVRIGHSPSLLRYHYLLFRIETDKTLNKIDWYHAPRREGRVKLSSNKKEILKGSLSCFFLNRRIPRDLGGKNWIFTKFPSRYRGPMRENEISSRFANYSAERCKKFLFRNFDRDEKAASITMDECTINRKSSSLNIIQVRPSRKWQTGRGREARGREKRERIKLLGVACNEDIPRSYFSRIIIYHEVNFGRDINASFSLPSPLFLFAETLTL